MCRLANGACCVCSSSSFAFMPSPVSRYQRLVGCLRSLPRAACAAEHGSRPLAEAGAPSAGSASAGLRPDSSEQVSRVHSLLLRTPLVCQLCAGAPQRRGALVLGACSSHVAGPRTRACSIVPQRQAVTGRLVWWPCKCRCSRCSLCDGGLSRLLSAQAEQPSAWRQLNRFLLGQARARAQLCWGLAAIVSLRCTAHGARGRTLPVPRGA